MPPFIEGWSAPGKIGIQVGRVRVIATAPDRPGERIKVRTVVMCFRPNTGAIKRLHDVTRGLRERVAERKFWLLVILGMWGFSHLAITGQLSVAMQTHVTEWLLTLAIFAVVNLPWLLVLYLLWDDLDTHRRSATWHAAEHMAIAALRQGKSDPATIQRCSRISNSCGTRYEITQKILPTLCLLAAWYLPAHLAITPPLLLAALGLTVWNFDPKKIPAIVTLSRFHQQHIGTRSPGALELATAAAAAQKITDLYRDAHLAQKMHESGPSIHLDIGDEVSSRLTDA